MHFLKLIKSSLDTKGYIKFSSETMTSENMSGASKHLSQNIYQL